MTTATATTVLYNDYNKQQLQLLLTMILKENLPYLAQSAVVIEYTDFFSAQEKNPTPQKSFLDMTLNNLMEKFQLCRRL